MLKLLRRWLRKLDRRWIPDTGERERHEGVVRDRLPSGVKPETPRDPRKGSRRPAPGTERVWDRMKGMM